MVLMTGAAFDGIDTVTIRSTVNPHRVQVAVVPLPREIPYGVAIHTTRVTKHRNDRFKGGCGSGIVTFCSLSRNSRCRKGERGRDQGARDDGCEGNPLNSVHALSSPPVP